MRTFKKHTTILVPEESQGDCAAVAFAGYLAITKKLEKARAESSTIEGTGSRSTNYDRLDRIRRLERRKALAWELYVQLREEKKNAG